jgi:protoheme IX farnesyltransferase
MRDYKQLSKFRLSALVALTASAGFAAGSGDSIDYEKLAWTSLGTLGAAACANTLNQLYEVANDARMARTCNRPLPAGRLSSRHALLFAVLSGVAGLWTLAEQVNMQGLAAGLAAWERMHSSLQDPVMARAAGMHAACVYTGCTSPCVSSI